MNSPKDLFLNFIERLFCTNKKEYKYYCKYLKKINEEPENYIDWKKNIKKLRKGKFEGYDVIRKNIRFIRKFNK
jgi:hypothetical protein